MGAYFSEVGVVVGGLGTRDLVQHVGAEGEQQGLQGPHNCLLLVVVEQRLQDIEQLLAVRGQLRV